MNLLSSDIANITGGKLFGPNDIFVNEVITDSRQFSNSEGKIFFAISGKNHDGHLFINTLYRNGLRVFCVERLIDEHILNTGAAFILVKDSVTALQNLAAYIRKSFRSPVIAITGSAGKTIVKEWLSEILGQTTPVIRSPKSYNSQIGVPLSVLKLEEKYKLGIFEAGISMLLTRR
jgi:UDP-N-acetylmuramyl pentapeptide synthase